LHFARPAQPEFDYHCHSFRAELPYNKSKPAYNSSCQRHPAVREQSPPRKIKRDRGADQTVLIKSRLKMPRTPQRRVVITFRSRRTGTPFLWRKGGGGPSSRDTGKGITSRQRKRAFRKKPFFHDQTAKPCLDWRLGPPPPPPIVEAWGCSPFTNASQSRTTCLASCWPRASDNTP